MRPPETVYRGVRVYDKQVITGVRVTVNGRELRPDHSRTLKQHSPGFEWSYSGGGPLQLALALVLDATGDQALALETYRYFKYAVATWGDTWEITAGEIRRWVQEAQREDAEEYGRPTAVIELGVDTPAPGCFSVPRCRACGCTDMNCSQCMAATGHPCGWVEGEEPPICTRCAEEEDAALVAEMGGEA